MRPETTGRYHSQPNGPSGPLASSSKASSTSDTAIVCEEVKKKKKHLPSAGDAEAQHQESSVVLSKIARIDLAAALFLNMHLITTLLLG